MSKYLLTRVTGVLADFAFDQSDHATVKIEFSLVVDIQAGPGLAMINPDILNNPMSLLAVIAAMGEMLGQVPDHWDPHRRLEFMEMAIRTTVSEAVCRDRIGG